MISRNGIIALNLRAVRRFMDMTQRQLARAMGCSQSYLARVEAAHKPLSKRLADWLEDFFELDPGFFRRDCYRLGRPPMTEEARELRGEIEKARPPEPKTERTPIQAPTHQRADLAMPRQNPFARLSDHPDLIKLEQDTQSDQLRWQRTNSVRFDSGAEKIFLLPIAARSAMVLGASFGSLGCELHSANGRTGRSTEKRAYPTFLFRHEGMAVAALPQRCVRTLDGYRWPDMVLIVAKNGRKRTLVVEVNGPTHNNAYKEKQRDRELGVPVYHLPVSRVDDPDALHQILDHAAQLLLSG